MPLTAGTRVGPYDVVASIGAGGMGEVYRAKDSRLGRDVAIKVLPTSFAVDPDRLKRFEQEARATGMLNHPNILAVYDVGTHDGAPYLVTELLEGRTLREELPVSRRKALDWARQLATGLAAAHAKGITHRDLKPENLFITTDGRAKILDFGLAKFDESGEVNATRTAITTPGVAMGTSGYMSPEQALGKPVDYRSDIFSFGAVLYEMLSGARAFSAPSTIETLNAILKVDPPPLADAGLERIVRRCLEKSPEQRFQSASDLAFDLESQSGTTAAVAALAPGRRAGAGPKMAVAAALALVAGVAAGLWWHARDDAAAPGWTAVRLGGPAEVANARLSPVGQSLAFNTEVDGQCQVGVMNPTSGDWTVVTHEREKGFAWTHSWSPDGAKIYFARQAGGSSSIFAVPVLGGDEQLVLEDAYIPEVLPDGSLIVGRINSERKPQLHHFWPQTRNIQPLAAESRNIRVSPDGKVVVFFGRPLPSPKPEPAYDYYVLDLSSNQVRRLTSAAPFGAMAIMPGSQSVLLMNVVGDLASILEVPLNGGATRRILEWGASSGSTMDVGSDGSLYLDNFERPLDVLRFPTSGGSPERLAGAPAGFGPDQVLEVPDGRVIFPTVVSGRGRLVAAKPGKDAGAFVQTDDETWTPATLVGTTALATLALQLQPAGNKSGSMLAIVSLSDGRIIRRFESTKGLRISGLAASLDGKTLYFTAAGSLWTIPAAGGEPKKLAAADSVAVDPNGLDVIVTRGEQDAIRLFRIPLSGGSERAIPFPKNLALAGGLWPIPWTRTAASWWTSTRLDPAGSGRPSSIHELATRTSSP